MTTSWSVETWPSADPVGVSVNVRTPGFLISFGVSDPRNSVRHAELMKRAHLAAAAPDLLEAAEASERALDLRRQVEGRRLGEHATLDPMTAIRAEDEARRLLNCALAKARGEEVGSDD